MVVEILQKSKLLLYDLHKVLFLYYVFQIYVICFIIYLLYIYMLIVRIQKICNLTGWNSVHLSDIFNCYSAMSMECETQENYI